MYMGFLAGVCLLHVHICLLGLAQLPPCNDLLTLGAVLLLSFVGPRVPGPFLKVDAGGALSENPALPGLF